MTSCNRVEMSCVHTYKIPWKPVKLLQENSMFFFWQQNSMFLYCSRVHKIIGFVVFGTMETCHLLRSIVFFLDNGCERILISHCSVHTSMNLITRVRCYVSGLYIVLRALKNLFCVYMSKVACFYKDWILNFLIWQVLSASG